MQTGHRDQTYGQLSGLHDAHVYNRKSRLYLRASELKHVADGLLQYHYDRHLDKQVCETPTRMTLQSEGRVKCSKCNQMQYLNVKYIIYLVISISLTSSSLHFPAIRT